MQQRVRCEPPPPHLPPSMSSSPDATRTNPIPAHTDIQDSLGLSGESRSSTLECGQKHITLKLWVFFFFTPFFQGLCVLSVRVDNGFKNLSFRIKIWTKNSGLVPRQLHSCSRKQILLIQHIYAVTGHLQRCV